MLPEAQMTVFRRQKPAAPPAQTSGGESGKDRVHGVSGGAARFVTFMLAETIVRKTRAKFPHQCVARHLCDHARRRNTQAQAIAIDDRCLGEWERDNRQAIDQCMLGRNRKACHRDPHGQVRGAKNIDLIDLDQIRIPTAQTMSDRVVRFW